MWKNNVQPGRPQVTKWRISCWIPKATNAHSQYVILTAFPLQQWLYECTSMLRYTYKDCLVIVASRRTPDPAQLRINTGGTLPAGSKRSGREVTILPFSYDIRSVVSFQLTKHMRSLPIQFCPLFSVHFVPAAEVKN
jgi:hypothetical protein